jgi:two-component SAPR family response regulator
LALQKKIGQYYEAQVKWDLATQHYLAAEDEESACRVIEALAPSLLHSGRIDILQRYLETLSEICLDQRPALWQYKGSIMRRRGHIDQAMQCYQRAYTLYLDHNKQEAASQVMTYLADVVRSRGDYRQASELAQQALTLATTTDSSARVLALLSLAKSEGFLDGMARGRQLAEEAQAILEKIAPVTDSVVLAQIYISLGHLWWWSGEPATSANVFKQALRVLSESVSPLAALAHIRLTTPYLYWADLAQAEVHARKGLALCERLHLIEYLPSAHLALGDVLARKGESEAAEKVFRQAIEQTQELGLESYAYIMATTSLAANLSKQGRLTEAQERCRSALRLYEGHPETYEICVCRSVLGDLLLDAGELTLAEQLFVELRQTCEQRQFRLPLAMVYFALAYIKLQSREPNAALPLAKESMAIIEQSQAIQLYLDQGERAVAVCQALQARGFYLDLTRRILTTLGQAKATGVVEPISSPQDIIQVTTLGSFQIERAGQLLGKAEGLSGKTRDLLAYFVIHRHQAIPLERVVESLWPSHPPAQGQAVFHTTLYRLRRALQQPGKNLKYIQPDMGDYRLDGNLFKIDIDEFETTLKRAAKSSGSKSIELYQQAVDLYAGDLLANLYEDWCEEERQRLQNLYFTSLKLLAEKYAAQDEYLLAIKTCQRILALDPLQEEIYCQIFTYAAKTGDRKTMIKHYDQLVDVLEQELEEEPMPDTQLLFQQLLEAS